MTVTTPPQPQPQVTCPICLERIVWVEDQLLEWVSTEARYQQIDLTTIGNPQRRAFARSRCYVKCPNPAKDTEDHYLPTSYVDYGPPLVVGLVGRPRSSKTHLLVAMIHQLLQGEAGKFRVLARTVDEVRHASFQRSHIDPFLQGQVLEGTAEGTARYTEWLLVETPAGRRPLIFFDVAGEDFANEGEHGRNARFLFNASCLLVVEDVTKIVPIGAGNAAIAGPRAGGRNEWIDGAISRLEHVRDMKTLPVAVALAKSDQLRYQYPIDNWLRRIDNGPYPNLRDFLEESRDAYAWLEEHDVAFLLSLCDKFRRCTLHFVSATGMAADGDSESYPRGVNPMRVLQPLLALLAMTGGFGPAAEREVGM